jgi:hypothetical protein
MEEMITTLRSENERLNAENTELRTLFLKMDTIVKRVPPLPPQNIGRSNTNGEGIMNIVINNKYKQIISINRYYEKEFFNENATQVYGSKRCRLFAVGYGSNGSVSNEWFRR